MSVSIAFTVIPDACSCLVRFNLAKQTMFSAIRTSTVFKGIDGPGAHRLRPCPRAVRGSVCDFLRIGAFTGLCQWLHHAGFLFELEQRGSKTCLDILNFHAECLTKRLMIMYYYAPGPLLWVTPLTAFATPVPPTASYYTVPQYYLPPAAPIEPTTYCPSMVYAPPVAPIEPATCCPPMAYGAPVAYQPLCYPPVPAPSPPRGEYRLGRCLLIC